MSSMSGGALRLDRRIGLDHAASVALGRCRLVLDGEAVARLDRARARFDRAVAKERHIYGVTTGFGPLANRLVPADRIGELQQNLVHHLASGVGPYLDWATARAVVLARLVSLVQGVSAASVETVELLVALLNSDLAPELPARGTVGASGDLTPLAHLVLCLQGRGAFRLSTGQRLKGRAGLDRIGAAPLDLARRDGLALVNGTSAMTGIALMNADAMRGLLDWAIAVSAMMAEALSARAEAWDSAFSRARPHLGQGAVAARLRERIEDSVRIVFDPIAARSLAGLSDIAEEGAAGQDAYSLRCVPQVLGGVWDVADWHRGVTAVELGSATDNPLFPEDEAIPALHGGNFMGVNVALASDALSNAVCVLAGLVERQVARVTDERLNGGLPPFLAGGPAGLNSGFMGAQVTATALLAEMRAVGAASVQSISTNGANQDVVSQGTIAARLAGEKIELAFRILAIAALAAAQAMDLAEARVPGRPGAASAHTRAWIRGFSPPLERDRPLSAEIERLARALRRAPPP